MAWSGISLTDETRLVINRGHLNATRSRDEILQLVIHLHLPGPNSILQEDNTRPHTAGFVRDDRYNLEVEMMEWPDLK